MRDALRDFLQELRSAQRERVRLVKMAGWGDRGLGERSCVGLSRGPPLACLLGMQDELKAQTSTLSQQLAEMEAERDHAASRAKQLQKAVAESEEGGSSLSIPLPPILLAAEVGGWGIGVNGS